MDEELTLFYEDSSDQLAFMEEALLDISDNGVNAENMGGLFRAMHTIKGTAGMFGFDDLVSFTHIAENLLDEMRTKQTAFDDDLLQLFLDVKDYTSLLVEANVNEEVLTEDARVTQDILSTALASYLDANTTAQNSANGSEEQTLDFRELNTQDSDMWHVSVRFSEDFFTSGMDILSIFNYFSKIGEIIINTPVINTIPLIEDIDPLKTYIGFEIEFQSTCSKEDIQEIFEFVEDDVVLFIFKTPNEEAFQELFEAYDGLKEILLEACVYEQVQEEVLDVAEEVAQIKEIEQIQTQDTQLQVPKKQANSSLRVESNKIDALINQMSEIVIANAKVEALAFASENAAILDIAITASS